MTEAVILKYSAPLILGLLFWAIGFNSGWRVRGDFDREGIPEAYRRGWRECGEAVVKEFKIELAVVKEEKALKQDLIGH